MSQNPGCIGVLYSRSLEKSYAHLCEIFKLLSVDGSTSDQEDDSVA